MNDKPFPRQHDRQPHAWGLTGDTPQYVWERFSSSYEAQAEAVWDAFAALGWDPALDWAGSEDGEAIVARDQSGTIVVLYHLENPEVAEALQSACQDDRLEPFIQDTFDQLQAEAARYVSTDK